MSGRHRWADTRGNLFFRKQTGVERHAGLVCLCPLIECCHNEDTDEGDRWRVRAASSCRSAGSHTHSGSPASGYTQPWEPGDESWRDSVAAPSDDRGIPMPSPGLARALAEAAAPAYLAALRDQVQQARDIHYGQALEYGEMPRKEHWEREERAYGRVEAYDEVLAMLAGVSPATEGENR